MSESMKDFKEKIRLSREKQAKKDARHLKWLKENEKEKGDE